MNENHYWKLFKEKICFNRVILWSAIITTIVSYGFTITNFSIGIDDPMRTHYLSVDGWGSLIQQGRLLHIAFNYLTGLVDFIPFFNDIIGAGLFCLSALLFAALFQYITNNKLSTLAVTAFCCIYISYSIINEKFIYQLDVIVTMLSYCCSALALLYAFKFVEEGKKLAFIQSILLVIVAIGSYESFIFLFFCGVFVIFTLQICICDEKVKFKTFLLKGIKYALILSIAVFAYYSLVYVVQKATGQYGIFVRNNPWGYSNNYVETFKQVSKTLLCDLLEFNYLPILEFIIFTLLGVTLFIVLSIKKKSFVLFASFCCLFAGNFLIHYVCGYIMYRGAQTFCLFVAFIALMLLQELQKQRWLKKPLIAIVVLVVILQAADMNRWFWNDYNRSQKESFVIHTLATRLMAECDISKPVVFVNPPSSGYLSNGNYYINDVNGNSLIYWGVDAFSKTAMYEIFDIYGYDFFVRPTEEEVQKAQELSEDMAYWPNKDCIKEMDEFIVVNMGVQK